MSKKEELIEEIKTIIRNYGSFSTGEVLADCSPCIKSIGNTVILAEKFSLDTVTAVTNVDEIEADENEVPYESLEIDTLESILDLAKKYADDQMDEDEDEDEKVFDTSYGEVRVTFAMIDTDGTNLSEGVDFNLDGEFVGDAIGLSLSEINEDNIEDLLLEYCDL
jgi:hypothetical protein